MRILQIVSGTALNGAVRYGLTLSKLLAERGHGVTLLRRPPADFARLLDPCVGIEVVESSLRRAPDELRRIAALCRTRRIDVIHSHMSRAHAFGALLRLLYGVPCVATAHRLKIQAHWWVNDRVICHNAEALRYQRRRNLVAASRLRIAPLFVDPRDLAADPEPRQATRRRLGIPAESLLLISIGDIVVRKGLIDIIEALPKVARVHSNVCLLLSGWRADRGYHEQIVQRARTLGVAERLVWQRLSDVDRVHALRASDLFVQASRDETGPITVLEAMALGLPVVGTRCGAMPDFILPEVTGAIVPVASPQALADAIIGLLGDPNRLAAMGGRSQERFAARFRADDNVPLVESILTEAATRPPKS